MTVRDWQPALAGTILFGVGWGLAEYCPGPGIAALSQGATDPVRFAGKPASTGCHGFAKCGGSGMEEVARFARAGLRVCATRNTGGEPIAAVFFPAAVVLSREG